MILHIEFLPFLLELQPINTHWHLVKKAPSPAGEGWDEGNLQCCFLFISPSPNPLPLERA